MGKRIAKTAQGQGRRWGVYVRVSSDREGDHESIELQEGKIRKRLADMGEDGGARLYPENDTSAFHRRRIAGTNSYRVVRPVWQRMLEDIRNGVIDAVMTYDLDRLVRDMRDLEDAIDAAEQFHCRFESYIPGSFDLTTDNGITNARVLTAMANKSSRDTARRVRDRHAVNALNGEPVGGGRVFGWEDDRMTERKDEADVIREMATRFLDGELLSTLCVDLNERGILTARGRPWRRESLANVLRNPRLCGQRVYHGDVLTDAAGEPIAGKWDAILRIDVSEQLRDRLVRRADRAKRPTPHPHGTGRKFVFSGILRCGLCGTKMGGNARSKPHANGFVYLCPSVAGGGCGRIAIDGPKVDLLLSELVITHIEARQVRPVVTDNPWPGEADLATKQRQHAETTAAYKANVMTAVDAFPLIASLTDEIKELQAGRRRFEQQARRTRPLDLDMSVRQRWESGTLAKKRELVEAVLTMVTVDPAVRGHHFNPDRLQPYYVE